MKFILLLLVVSCATTGPHIPGLCQKNLQYCTEAYSASQESWCKIRSRQNLTCSADDWQAGCLKDLQVCKSNWGM